MSLTSLYKSQPELRKWFKVRWPKVNMNLKNDIIVDSTASAGMSGVIGTEFDYLIRFKVEKLNPERVEKRRLIAESYYETISLSSDDIKLFRSDDIMTDEIQHERAVKQILNAAQKNVKKYLSGKIELQDLCIDALKLASIDIVYRTGMFHEMVGIFNNSCVEDLKLLVGIIGENGFIVANKAILNPTFGSGSSLIGGADGDLILDDTLVDIKTSNSLRQKRTIFDQLIGYFILSRIGKIYSIKNISVYFARFAEFWSISIEKLFDSMNVENEIKDFSNLILALRKI